MQKLGVQAHRGFFVMSQQDNPRVVAPLTFDGLPLLRLCT